MVKNPIHLRLQKLAPWQLNLFMLLLCERMVINYDYFCQKQDLKPDYSLSNMVHLGFESLMVKKAKINFDSQLDKLEKIIPEIDDQSDYLIYPAIDAIEAVSAFLHAQLAGDELEYAIKVSQLSLKTIIDLESEKQGALLNDKQMKENEVVIDELDIQWELYRVIQAQTALDPFFVKALWTELKEINQSNIGLFLAN